jgi:hypothetical protein
MGIQSAPRHVASASRLGQCAPRHVVGPTRCSQSCRHHSQHCHWSFEVLPGAPKVHSGALRYSPTYHNHSHDTPVSGFRDSSYSECQLECPPRVWYTPEIDASKFSLHILSDTPGGSWWLQYILLLQAYTFSLLNKQQPDIEVDVLFCHFKHYICCTEWR